MLDALRRFTVPGFLILSVFCLPMDLKADSQTPASGSVPAPLDFQEIYQRVLAYYPRLKSQHAKVEEAVAAKYEAYAALMPKVEGLSSVTHGDDPVAVFGSLLRQEAFSATNFQLPNLNHPDGRTNFNFTLRGEMPLFNAFQTLGKIRSSKSLLAAAKQQEAFTRMEAALLSLEGYLKELLVLETFEFTQSSQDAGLNDLKQAGDLKDKGMVLGADFFGAKMIFAEIRQMHQQQTMNQKNARILLNILMGEAPETGHTLSGKLPERVREAKPLDEWIAEAFQSRPDLAAFQAKVEAQKAEVSREKMSALPRVKAFADLTEDSHDLQTGGENYMMGFQGKMDLLDAAYWARRKKAAATYQALQAEYRTFKDQVAKDVSQAVHGFESIHSNLPIAEEAFQDGREAVKQTEVLYREGRKSIVDLLEIRRAFLLTVLRRNELIFQSQMAYANLLFLTGQLKDPAVMEMTEPMDGAR